MSPETAILTELDNIPILWIHQILSHELCRKHDWREMLTINVKLSLCLLIKCGVINTYWGVEVFATILYEDNRWWMMCFTTRPLCHQRKSFWCYRNRKLDTQPLVREGTPNQQTRDCLKIILREKKGKKLVMSLRLVTNINKDLSSDRRS
jgi:hypothetical protein